MAKRPLCVTLMALLLLLTAERESPALPIRTTDPNVGIFSGTAALGRVEFVEASRSGVDVSATIAPAALLYSPTTYTRLAL